MQMTTNILKFVKQHLFVSINGNDWLIDTGAPSSFGDIQELEIHGKQFSISDDYSGLTATKLSEHLDHQTIGLIGTDILNTFNILFDVAGKKISFTLEKIKLNGEELPITQVMGIPIVTAVISGAEKAMFLDTGAQISYLQNEALSTYPAAGTMEDFYPGIGAFQTDTYLVDVNLGNQELNLRCGILPELLGMTLMMAGTEGIIGNELFIDRLVGYFPQDKCIILAGKKDS